MERPCVPLVPTQVSSTITPKCRPSFANPCSISPLRSRQAGDWREIGFYRGNRSPYPKTHLSSPANLVVLAVILPAEYGNRSPPSIPLATKITAIDYGPALVGE